jgi:hypothetical protein
LSEAERAAEKAEYRDLIRSMREERIFLAAEEVEHYDAARTVRYARRHPERVRRSCCERRCVAHWLLPD